MTDQSSSKENIMFYLNKISSRIEEKIIIVNKLEKISDRISIPTIYNFKNILHYNYTIEQLKKIAKHYKLKLTGTKKELISRIYVFFQLSYHIIKIQTIFRGYIERKINILRGPAYKNRNICTNNTDFITLENINNLHINQFFSYKDVDNFIYGFDIASINTLIDMKHNTKNCCKNPYNRNNIPPEVLLNIKLLIKLGKVFKKNIYLEIQDDTSNISSQKIIELRTLSLFQNINALGNYSNYEWFLSLSRMKLLKLVKELCDIWNYRAQLSVETKRNICPPNGNPFSSLSISYIYNEIDINNIRKVILEFLEKLVNSGIDSDSKSLGAYYVLASLTLVNEETAIALPWLFQSVSHF